MFDMCVFPPLSFDMLVDSSFKYERLILFNNDARLSSKHVLMGKVYMLDSLE